MNLNQWFEQGLTAEQYIAGMNVNQERMNKIIEGFSLSSEEKDQMASLKGKGLKVIALSEDWCGDALLNNPILLKIAEEIEMEVRFVLRDQNLELMDQYLTNGTSRAIPIYIFINEQGEEQAVWGPRAEHLQELVMQERSKLPAQEDPDFADKQKAMYKGLVEMYQADEKLWHAVAKSIIARMTKSE
ncbi:hypothetical protein J2Z40_001473 [Cytobacillus eiseniae]|uniref:Thioredoxin family protein n=1 Tax=Cytobacillus eiseniae TaxID=762947 RepID=A0ABS4RDD9_9BACI|nr:thioredoxin family protein [Cytobacillus eiseniae]MBP2240913.1 hypothetical protein [Cytobacillus eiseniae]